MSVERKRSKGLEEAASKRYREAEEAEKDAQRIPSERAAWIAAKEANAEVTLGTVTVEDAAALVVVEGETAEERAARLETDEEKAARMELRKLRTTPEDEEEVKDEKRKTPAEAKETKDNARPLNSKRGK